MCSFQSSVGPASARPHHYSRSKDRSSQAACFRLIVLLRFQRRVMSRHGYFSVRRRALNRSGSDVYILLNGIKQVLRDFNRPIKEPVTAGALIFLRARENVPCLIGHFAGQSLDPDAVGRIAGDLDFVAVDVDLDGLFGLWLMFASAVLVRRRLLFAGCSTIAEVGRTDDAMLPALLACRPGSVVAVSAGSSASGRRCFVPAGICFLLLCSRWCCGWAVVSLYSGAAQVAIVAILAVIAAFRVADRSSSRIAAAVFDSACFPVITLAVAWAVCMPGPRHVGRVCCLVALLVARSSFRACVRTPGMRGVRGFRGFFAGGCLCLMFVPVDGRPGVPGCVVLGSGAGFRWLVHRFSGGVCRGGALPLPGAMFCSVAVRWGRHGPVGWCGAAAGVLPLDGRSGVPGCVVLGSGAGLCGLARVAAVGLLLSGGVLGGVRMVSAGRLVLPAGRRVSAHGGLAGDADCGRSWSVAQLESGKSASASASRWSQSASVVRAPTACSTALGVRTPNATACRARGSRWAASCHR